MATNSSILTSLDTKDAFSDRHIGPDFEEISSMLGSLKLNSMDDLIDQAIPNSIRAEFPSDLESPLTEQDALSTLSVLAKKNKINRSMIGMGYSDTFTPPLIQRNIIENPGWYTAYTPYQPEISQGRLEALLVFQTMVIDLTAMDCANASLLDEATAAAEALHMSYAISKTSTKQYFVSQECHPQTISIMINRAKAIGIDIVVGDHNSILSEGDFFGALLQYPATGGTLYDYKNFIDTAHDKDIIVTVAADLLSLVKLVPPGEFGADIVVGSAQRFGVPMGFGGPHAAFFATHEKYKRAMPGRIVGVSVDTEGNSALRLALQTREQHIRREKATSNICTAQVLLAVVAAMYAVYHGPDGLTAIATRIERLLSLFVHGLKRGGLKVNDNSWFDTITIKVSGEATSIIEMAAIEGFNLRFIDKNHIGVSFDETTDLKDVIALLKILVTPKISIHNMRELEQGMSDGIPKTLRRQTDILSPHIFGVYKSETEMLRYLRRLEVKDITLNQSMIPLGSCTMKLNATAEMIPITWSGFARIHPYVPLDQASGYMELIDDLEKMLCKITGFSAVSLQPNAGSQGEYAGLLAIRSYHESKGESSRDICLIPSSAHGTNPASAVLAGLTVVVIACDTDGNIDIPDLKSKVETYKARLAALMITYPSTHGVFEESIIEVCKMIHDAGGQVYLDGANLNALLGVSLPGKFGPDVAHMNLHKTFCIPHGGGGPGVGPIGVREHLAEHLPGHPLASEHSKVGAVAAAPWGSAGILPISWAYIAMMGSEGLKKATKTAILNANYVAHKLAPYYSVLYRGKNGWVAHECIIDVRPFKNSADISVDDICKRLMDYGFHAPTMSFPVAGTLMIEPTESESKSELDRFCAAMISIREEIKKIESDVWGREDNPLKNAPHTALQVSASEWSHEYSRETAAFPVSALKSQKYWPPVSRIDHVYGDRNLVCSCPPLSAYL